MMMYTNINMCGVLLFEYMPESVKDVIRASSMFILSAVATVWISGNVLEVYEDLVDSFTPEGVILPNFMKRGIMIVYDILFHIVPFVILGLPHHIISLCIAYGIIVIWFMMTRHDLSSIYSSKIVFKRGMVVAGLVGVVVAIWIGHK